MPNIKPIASSLTTTKIVRPSSPSVKATEPLRSTGLSTVRPRPAIITKAKIDPAHHPATRIPTATQPPTRVSDLDVLMNRQQADETKSVASRSNSLSSSTVLDQIPRILFLPETVKHVRPVRSEELKIFSSQVPSDQFNRTHESLSTVQLESTDEPEPVADLSGSSNLTRDLSEDSLNEHYHIQKLLQHSKWKCLA